MFFLSDMDLMASSTRFQAVVSGNLPTFQSILSHHHLLILFTWTMAGFTSNILLFISLFFRVISRGMTRGTFGFVFFISNECEGIFRHGGIPPGVNMFLIHTLVAPNAGLRADIGDLLLGKRGPFLGRALLQAG